MEQEKTTYPHPNRPPKKFTAKSLHGRTRLYILTYKDLKRFQNFYIKLFGWDMIEMPEAASGIPAGDEHPSLLIATGPAQYDYEGVTPGHMNMAAHWAQGELENPGPWMEIHMDRPLEDTIQEIIDHGGKLILDQSKSALAKPLDDSKQSWQIHAVVEDPAGNYIYLWKCPSSRTWDELETEYDVEEGEEA
ncbi:MAG: hypothetical protein K2N01_03650 [Lachnospiraceae bacterium]|nr:hypothetical protein [Lachnospiraceae bacterium]